MATKRIEWIDYARALSIWLIVFGHSSINSDVVNQYLNSFHVAVFFMISGLFEKNLEESNLKTRITKGIKTLLLPYFFFNIIGLFSCWISPYIHPELYYGVSGINIWRNAIIGIFLFDDVVTPHSFLPIGPTWFLASLFLCKVLFWLFLKVIDLKTIIRIVFIIGFLTALFALYYADFGMFSLDTTALSFPFYLAGFFLKKKIIKCRFNLLLLLIFITGFIFSSYFNGTCNFDAGSCGNNLVLFYIAGCLGSLSLLELSKIIPKGIKTLSYIGQNTLTIVGVHITLIYVCKAFLVVILGIQPDSFPIYISIIISILVVLLCCPVVWFINKYIPFVVGKSK